MKAVSRVTCLLAVALCAGCAMGPSDRDFEIPEARPVDPALLAMSPAEFDAWDASERDRIDDRRDRIQRTYDAAEAVCWQRFAVTDCINGARRVRRRGQEQVRAQELTLNAAERARRTRARLDSIQRRQEH